jgi:hypothetical protein
LPSHNRAASAEGAKSRHISLPVKVPHGKVLTGKGGVIDLINAWLAPTGHKIAALQSGHGTLVDWLVKVSASLLRVHLGDEACIICSNRQPHGEHAGENDHNRCQCDTSFHRLFSFTFSI